MQKAGFRITTDDPKYIRGDIPEEFLALLPMVKPFTMLWWERLFAIYEAVEYVCAKAVPGGMAVDGTPATQSGLAHHEAGRLGTAGAERRRVLAAAAEPAGLRGGAK